MIKHISILPFVALVVCCYLFYPLWRLRTSQISSELIVLAGLYIILLTLLLCWILLREIEEYIIICSEDTLIEEKISVTPVWILLLFFSTIQFWFLTLPILSGPDEPEHVFQQLQQAKYFRESSFLITVILISSCSLLTFLIPALARSLVKSFQPGTLRMAFRVSRSIFIFVIIGTVLAVAFHAGDAMHPDWGRSYRWPPLGSVLSSLAIVIFGENIISSRVVSFLFYLGTGFYLYKIAEREAGRWCGMGACIIALGCPIMFAYGHLGYRETGGTFFLSVAMYYLVAFLRTPHLSHLSLCFASISAGFLMRRPTVVIIFILPLIFLWDFCKRVQQGTSGQALTKALCDKIVLFSIFIMVIFPWVFFAPKVRSYQFYLDNFNDPKLLTAYAEILPSSLTWPIAILFLIGVVVTLIKRQQSGVISISVFVLLYILFTGDQPYWIPEKRFTVLMVPSVALLAALPLSIAGRWQKQGVLMIFLFVLLGIGAWIVNIKPTFLFPANTATFSSYPYYPFNQVVRSMKRNGIPAGNIIYPAYCQPSSSVYYVLQRVNGYHNVTPKWKPKGKDKVSISQLQEGCTQKKCKALILYLRRHNDSVSVNWLTDLQGEQILANNVPFFDVVDIVFRNNYGLAILVPSDPIY